MNLSRALWKTLFLTHLLLIMSLLSRHGFGTQYDSIFQPTIEAILAKQNGGPVVDFTIPTQDPLSAVAANIQNEYSVPEVVHSAVGPLGVRWLST
ncbi:hypothetical protein B0H11DRAFT_250335 [Mycena galericulata]|nr:hypothetical protein B0H11DRAFT_250335 [Mycena galericulata]